jgi:hypothetical protein
MYNIHKVLKLRFSAFLDHFIHQFTFNSKAANKPSESRRPMAYLTFPLRHSCPQSPKIPNPPKTDALDHAPRRRRSRVASRDSARQTHRRPPATARASVPGSPRCRSGLRRLRSPPPRSPLPARLLRRLRRGLAASRVPGAAERAEEQERPRGPVASR